MTVNEGSASVSSHTINQLDLVKVKGVYWRPYKLMHVGICNIRLRLPENLSLKGKRQVLKSINTRVRSKFNVSIAEVDDNDLWQLATLGICCVSNNKRQVNEVLSKVADFI
ncbi:DUF503 domain-containing protein, partial [Chloroflexota bacterium]